VLPIGALTRESQALAPKPIEPQLLPQFGEQPAAAPLPRAVQLKIPQAHLHAVGRARGQSALRGKEFELGRPPALLIKDFNGANPLLFLAVVDLPEIKHRVLHDAPGAAAPVFHQRPVIVWLAVFEASGAAQKHDACRL
jgi:hypothetical protein